GPSPGFKNLKWRKPIYAGDTVTFASEVIELRPSASRPQWGVVHMFTQSTNQKGERVYEIENIAFIERRAA
ncbi:MAG TPA: MaoC family dehydratase N-terminal domain-containing protein, partial [Xanthobacteraceae bacterium]